MKCFYCGSDDHPWFNCRKKPKGWKPPKTLAGGGMGDAPRSRSGQEQRARPAKLQVQFLSGPTPETDANAPPVEPPKRGRPRTGFDKKAYDAERMRKRRAKLKDG